MGRRAAASTTGPLIRDPRGTRHRRIRGRCLTTTFAATRTPDRSVEDLVGRGRRSVASIRKARFEGIDPFLEHGLAPVRKGREPAVEVFVGFEQTGHGLLE